MVGWVKGAAVQERRWKVTRVAILSARVMAVALSALLAACSLPYEQLGLPKPVLPPLSDPGPVTGSVNRGTPLGSSGSPEAEQDRAFQGAAKYINDVPQSQSGGSARSDVSTDGSISLDLVNASVAEAAKTVLGDIMQVNYVVSDKVRASITLKTARPVNKQGLLEIFESLLGSQGASIIVEGSLYKIIPSEEAVAAGKPLRMKGVANRNAAGLSNQIVPLRYVAATEMERILKSVAPQNTISRVDTDRNLLVISGTSADITSMIETINVFDVDWMRNMSFGIFPIETSDPEAIAQELDKIFANDHDSPTKGLVRFIPNSRLKAVLVITSRPEYLKKAETWIDRIDMAGRATEKQVFVYHVQFRPASEIAQLLRKIYGVSRDQNRTDSSQQPAAQAPLTTSSVNPQVGPEIFAPDAGRPSTQPGLAVPQPLAPTSPGGTKPSSTAPAAESTSSLAPGLSDGTAPGIAAEGQTQQGVAQGQLAQPPPDDRETGISVIPDETNNTVVISATAAELKRIKRVLSQIDVLPNQLLLEATIAEVTLTDDLKFGLRWFFEKGGSQFKFTDSIRGLVAPVFPGFSYFMNFPNAQVALNALAQITNVDVVSSPSLMVLDNKKAILQIGDEVPIATQSAVGVLTPDAPIVNAISFRNTGVILNITPRVSDDGRVMLEIEQEVSDVKKTTTSTIDSPTIQQRRIKTTVSVNNGECIILAGMMQDRSTRNRGQVPIVGDIPLVGNLFKNKQDTIARTELLIAITPHVVKDSEQIGVIAAEFRDRLNLTTRPQRQTPPDRREQLDRLVR